jgi:hypothetical protein
VSVPVDTNWGWTQVKGRTKKLDDANLWSDEEEHLESLLQPPEPPQDAAMDAHSVDDKLASQLTMPPKYASSTHSNGRRVGGATDDASGARSPSHQLKIARRTNIIGVKGSGRSKLSASAISLRSERPVNDTGAWVWVHGKSTSIPSTL